MSNFETGANMPVGVVGDYVGNAGTSQYLLNDDWAQFTEDVDGVFNSGYAADNPVVGGKIGTPRGRYKFSDIDTQDGLSNTFFVGEKAVNVNNMKTPGGWGDGAIYNGNEPGSSMRLGGIGLGLAVNQNMPAPGATPVFGSSHPKLVNFLKGDGSVKSYSVSLDEEILRRLCSRRDGENVDLP